MKRAACRIAFLVPVLLVGQLSFGDCVFDSPDDALGDAVVQDGVWDPVGSNSDGICVWVRKSPTSPVHEVAAAGAIRAQAQVIADLINDCARYPEVFQRVESCIVEQEHDEGAVVFQQLDFPWPVADRYYTIDLRNHTLGDGVLEVSWTRVKPAAPLRAGRGVAVAENIGRWHLRPTADGRHTDALYYLYTDPGGQIPKLVVNRGNRIAVPDVIRDARNAVESDG